MHSASLTRRHSSSLLCSASLHLRSHLDLSGISPHSISPLIRSPLHRPIHLHPGPSPLSLSHFTTPHSPLTLLSQRARYTPPVFPRSLPSVSAVPSVVSAEMTACLSYDMDVDVLLAAPFNSTMPTRWERKQLQLKHSSALPSSSSSSSSCPSSPPRSTPSTPSTASILAPKTPSRLPSAHQSKTPKSYTDRFIPLRDSTSHPPSSFSNENLPLPSSSSPSRPTAQLNSHLASSLFTSDELTSKILTFKQKAPRPHEGHQSHLRVLYTQNRDLPVVKRVQHRHIATAPERVLDAPNLSDDYYLNLIDWSVSNVLAVALGSEVYMWDAASGSIDLLCELNSADTVTSVQWMADGSHLAIGTSSASNDVQLWNVVAKKQMRSMKGHEARVGSLAWNGHLLSSGSRDSTIIHHDVRIAKHQVSSLRGHVQEICGLKWNQEGTQLASGGNDNQCCIWDLQSSAQQTPRYTLTEACAAVKALAWCPFQRNTLATGAGTADRHIRFYNSTTGALLQSIDTQSQVTSLQWSRTERELLSSHGFSKNQLAVWKYPTLVKVAELEGHTSRVLHTAMSPDGGMVVSAAADETLRFWKVWEGGGERKKKEGAGGLIGVGTAGPSSMGRRGALTMSMR